MTADNEPDDTGENPIFGFQTPFGIVHDPDDLPPEAREALIETYRHGDLPGPVRAALGKALRIGRHAASTPAPVIAPQNSLQDVAEHRQALWGILDSAFPNDPHLWSAGEALFTLSAEQPTTADESQKRAALEDATRHLQHHAARFAAPLSPVDQMVEAFREQLDG